ncbi:hypothetical protein [Miniimonas arenae]|uniref:hypothetical protein n=1 Tax=Miniimonas arenae TaxID=676201 RepID=UPI0028AC8CCF|nr:hypothetical protein [Miniimonas arenae]
MVRRRVGGPVVAGGETLVAIRSADEDLIDLVRDVVAWWGAQVLVRPPGTPPPPAHVHVDSASERLPGDPSWGRGTSIAVSREPVAGAIVLPAGAEDLADAVALALSVGTARTVGVLGACGGLGTSVTAALLARCAADAGRSTALLDLAGGIDLLLSLEDEPGPRWADLPAAGGPYVGEQLVAALPTWQRVRVLTSDARGGADPRVRDQVAGALAGVVRLVVLDLGAAPRDLASAALCDDLVLLTSPEVRAVAAVRAQVGQLHGRVDGPRPHLVVRSVRGLDLPRGEVEEACGLPVRAVLPHTRGMAVDLARGVTPGDRRRAGLTRAVRGLVRELGLA